MKQAFFSIAIRIIKQHLITSVKKTLWPHWGGMEDYMVYQPTRHVPGRYCHWLFMWKQQQCFNL